ncbi:MAG: DUF6457 domain-containing protein [Actinomycetota bacterium]
MSWLEELAAVLDVEPLTDAEQRTVLRLAREVAHRTERVNAPLAAYLAGRFAAATDRPDAAGEAFRRAEGILPPAAT